MGLGIQRDRVYHGGAGVTTGRESMLEEQKADRSHSHPHGKGEKARLTSKPTSSDVIPLARLYFPKVITSTNTITNQGSMETFLIQTTICINKNFLNGCRPHLLICYSYSREQSVLLPATDVLNSLSYRYTAWC